MQGLAMCLLSFVQPYGNLLSMFVSSCLLGFCDAILTTLSFKLVNNFVNSTGKTKSGVIIIILHHFKHSFKLAVKIECQSKKITVPLSFTFFKFYQAFATALFFAVSQYMLDASGAPLIKTLWLPITATLLIVSSITTLATNKARM
jgi:hypothetical protein